MKNLKTFFFEINICSIFIESNNAPLEDNTNFLFIFFKFLFDNDKNLVSNKISPCDGLYKV